VTRLARIFSRNRVFAQAEVIIKAASQQG
jgi:hypothetical protein